MYNAGVLFVCFITCSWLPMRENRMICKQKEFGEVRVLICPPVNHTDTADLGYCCSNNGLMNCCNYEDYKQRHVGPDVMTTVVIVVFQIGLVIVFVLWCYLYRCRT